MVGAEEEGQHIHEKDLKGAKETELEAIEKELEAMEKELVPVEKLIIAGGVPAQGR